MAVIFNKIHKITVKHLFLELTFLELIVDLEWNRSQIKVINSTFYIFLNFNVKTLDE